MSSKEDNACVRGATDVTKQGGSEEETVDRRIRDSVKGDGGEGGTAEVITGPRWLVEAYTEQ